MILLDLSAAFDTIDQSTVISCLQSWFGVLVSVLKWFTLPLVGIQMVHIASSRDSSQRNLKPDKTEFIVLSALLSPLRVWVCGSILIFLCPNMFRMSGKVACVTL